MAKPTAATPVVEETALVAQTPAAPPMTLDDFAAVAGDDGFEETSSGDYMIPRLKVLQGMSPQCTDGKPEFNENLRPGMLFNNVSEEAYSGKTGVYFIPSYYRQIGTLWDLTADRATSFRGMVDCAELASLLEHCAVDDKGNQIIQGGEYDGLGLSDTREWYGILSTTEDFTTWTPILLSLVSTQIKKSKKWLTVARNIRMNGKPVNMWSQVYHITTAPEVYPAGTIAGTFIKHVGQVPNMEIFKEAAMFREMVRGGTAKAVPEGDTAPMSDAPF